MGGTKKNPATRPVRRKSANNKNLKNVEGLQVLSPVAVAARRPPPPATSSTKNPASSDTKNGDNEVVDTKADSDKQSQQKTPQNAGNASVPRRGSSSPLRLLSFRSRDSSHAEKKKSKAGNDKTEKKAQSTSKTDISAKTESSAIVLETQSDAKVAPQKAKSPREMDNSPKQAASTASRVSEQEMKVMYTKSLVSNLDSVASSQQSAPDTKKPELSTEKTEKTRSPSPKRTDRHSAQTKKAESPKRTDRQSPDAKKAAKKLVLETSKTEKAESPKKVYEKPISPRAERQLSPKASQQLVELDEFSVPVEVPDESVLVQCLKFYDLKTAAKIAGVMISATDCRTDRTTHESFEVQMLGQGTKDDVENQRLREKYAQSAASPKVETVLEAARNDAEAPVNIVAHGDETKSAGVLSKVSHKANTRQRHAIIEPEEEEEHDDSTKSAPVLAPSRSRVREVTTMHLHLDQDWEAQEKRKATQRAKRLAAAENMSITSIEIPTSKTARSAETCDTSDSSSADVEIATPATGFEEKRDTTAVNSYSERGEESGREGAIDSADNFGSKGKGTNSKGGESSKASDSTKKVDNSNKKERKGGLFKRFSGRRSKATAPSVKQTVKAAATE
uniref:Uncharacterized protein n=1 Tax=Entomoneis paludosa TaxID=265537 RepID=A0A7S3DS23_9STRA|mmetsp:Transcript_32001/g.66795  ORF Transcript_32001/g.66795 Transcript_32001/m.66795 type:complete len:619 (+) Transcript_32001:1787-3643(+)